MGGAVRSAGVHLPDSSHVKSRPMPMVACPAGAGLVRLSSQPDPFVRIPASGGRWRRWTGRATGCTGQLCVLSVQRMLRRL